MISKSKYRKDKTKPIVDICIKSSIFCTESNHPIINIYLNHYTNKYFVLPDESFYDKIIIPIIMNLDAEKYGFKYIDDFQSIQLFSNDYFTNPAVWLNKNK